MPIAGPSSASSSSPSVPPPTSSPPMSSSTSPSSAPPSKSASPDHSSESSNSRQHSPHRTSTSTSPTTSSSPNFPSFHAPLDANPMKTPSPESVSSLLPLLSPVGVPIPNAASNHLDQSQSQSSRHANAVVAPEKCLTFCSQRQDAPPLCRMFCLRKRQSLPSQAEALARLRPPPQPSHRNRSAVVGETARTSDLGGTGTSPASSSTSNWNPMTFSWNPFESLRRAVTPYSLIYVRGTIDGVVGRYMEEMESDDGICDFGALSRGADDQARRRRDGGWEYLDWDDHGSMLYLPLTSLLHPILSIPTTISRILSPSRNFLQHYFDSFSNGAQLRSFERFKREVQDGGALKTLSKAQAHLEKKGREIREAREKASEKQEEEYRKTRPEWADNLRKMKGGPGGGKGPDGASGTKEDMESKPE